MPADTGVSVAAGSPSLLSSFHWSHGMSEKAANCLELKGARLDDDPVPAPQQDWIWHGYLARGSVTLLTSLWKTGKTTLLSVLLGRMRDGGLLAGRAVAACQAAVVTEEPLAMWRVRGQRLPLGRHVTF